MFRRAGFPVAAYPVDWQTRGPIDLLLPFDRVSDGLGRTDTAAHEWVGLVAYWMTGRTSELFPAPSDRLDSMLAQGKRECGRWSSRARPGMTTTRAA